MGSEVATSEHELTLQFTPAVPARTAEYGVGWEVGWFSAMDVAVRVGEEGFEMIPVKSSGRVMSSKEMICGAGRL